MTVASLRFGAGLGIPQRPDRGVSEDARRLRLLVTRALEYSPSIAIGEPKRKLLEALERAYQGARVGNWDGMGSAAVEASTMDYAREFIRLLPTSTANPDVYVDQDGEITLEWDSGPRCVFTVSIGRDGTLTFAGLFGRNRYHGTEQMVGDIPSSVAAGIQRVQRR